MRITLTAQTAHHGADLVVDCDEQTTAESLGTCMAAVLGSPASTLYVDGVAVAPDAVAESLGLLEGRRVGLGAPAPAEPAVPASGWQLHVVSGPDAGAVFSLPMGEHSLGRSGVISVNDSAMSRQHCRIVVDADGATLTDLGSSNGTRLDGALLDSNEATPVALGQMISVGHSVVTLRVARTSDAATEAAEPGRRHFLRQPRMLPHRPPLEVQVPTAPAEQRSRRFPIIAMVIPLVLGVGMAFMLGAPQYLLFSLMSPVMLGANFVSDSRSSAKDHRAAVEKYHVDLEASQERLVEAVAAEQERLRNDLPDAAETFLTAVLPGRRLWERRRFDDDALVVRVGTADIASSVRLSGGSEEQEQRLHCVPVSLSLRDSGVIGVAGPAESVSATVRWLVLQLGLYHPTRDLSVSLLAERGATDWSWVRWLPQFRPGSADGPNAFVGNDPDSVNAQISTLIGELDARKALMTGNSAVRAESFPARVLVVHGYRHFRTQLGLATLLEDGPAAGIYTICADEDERVLSERCTATLIWDLHKPDFATVRVSGQPDVPDVLVEGVSPGLCERAARAVAPLVDVGGDQGEAVLPDNARLVEVLDCDPPQADVIRARWAVEPRSTAMTIGVGLDGPFTLDLRRDGPHGLIAGGTGSGKTELLQTMIASLALANRPDELNFVLVDYKGDSAFKDCVNLPHTVGKVNDLDTHLVERALESLSAELRYREHFLAEAAVKDIEDYQLLLQKEPHRPPMPRLMLIIDEFASLFRELPDFVTGLVSIAQRGRSLGIHLLLATQRPSGVVSADIRANTNLRISLRVTDASDSVDVLQSPEAAHIAKSLPGRGYARLGAGSLLSFQSGRVGGRRPGAVVVDLPPPFVAKVEWPQLGYRAPYPVAGSTEADVKDTDLAAVVAAVCAAADADRIPEQRQPWLPALPKVLTRAEVYDVDTVPPATGSGVPALPFGRGDLPHLQQQEPVTFDLTRDGHMMIIGSQRSGRSQLLRALAGAVGLLASPRDLHLHALDCGTGMLNPLAHLPHAGVVASRSETERAARLFGRLGAEIDRRQQLFAQRSYADIDEQRRGDDQPLPKIVLMIDRWETFVTTLGEVDSGSMMDAVTRILREGASVGVHLVITGDRTLANHRIASLTECKFTLRLADRSDYSLVGISPKAVPDEMPPGRGFATDGVESQVVLLTEDADGRAQAAELVRIAEEATARAGTLTAEERPFRLDVLPSRVTLDEAFELRERTGEAEAPVLLVGVGGDELTAFGVDPTTTSSFLVAGPNRSGRSTALLAAVQSGLRTGVKVVVLAPRSSPLRDLAGTDGVLDVFTEASTSLETFEASLAKAEGAPVVVVLDDAEELRDCPAATLFMQLVRGAVPGASLLFGGAADGLQVGFSGWHVEARKARRGLLLSPQGMSDGELIGVRLPRSTVGGSVAPGLGLLHTGDGDLRRVVTLLPPV